MQHQKAIALCALLAACSNGPTEPNEEVIEIEVEGSRLVYHDAGWLELRDETGALILDRAFGSVMLDATDYTGQRVTTLEGRTREAELLDDSDALGDARRLVVTIQGEEERPDLVWTISAYTEGGFYTFQLDVENGSDQALDIAKISPLQIRVEEGGALYLGENPARHRILENGSLTLLDFVVEVLPGDVPRDDLFAPLVPGNFEGHSVSNWNHAVADLGGHSGWVSGALTFDASLPVFNLSYDEDVALESSDGRRGFTFFSAEAAYQPLAVNVEPGGILASEVYYLHPTEADAAAGLERYAERAAAYLGIVPWTQRDGGRRVPNGWNSWSGSGSSGGYGTDIDEELILTNLDIMATELRDWGMEWFQIDDGYEPHYGDWEWREDRFPHGPAWLAEQIRERGLRPGLWMAPFSPSPDSQLAADHPDWIADWTPIGSAMGGSGNLILDLTHPEVQDYLHELFRAFRHDWGFEWFKMDFAYLALMGTGFHDTSMTREEAWRQALGIIREELGEETFYMLVGTIGINYGLVDAGRTTLDSMPVWDWQPEADADDHLAQQGLKPTVRTAGRRWYLQDRLWINHPDLIFFRSNPQDETWPRLTLDEAQAFCTFIGLSGGIVKLGDRLVDLDADAINSIRQLLPTYGSAARPLDVFEREYPEVWHLPVHAPRDGLDEQFELFGLFHWGYNVDQTTEPYSEIPDDDEPRHHVLDLNEVGLDGDWLVYEFWTGESLGTVSDQLEYVVPPHSGRVLALRRPTGTPQLLGWNRQLSMGGTLVEEASWDEEAGNLSFRAQVAAPTTTAPFTYEIAFHVPEDFLFSSVATSGVEVIDVETQLDDSTLRIRFVPETTGDLELRLTFD